MKISAVFAVAAAGFVTLSIYHSPIFYFSLAATAALYVYFLGESDEALPVSVAFHCTLTSKIFIGYLDPLSALYLLPAIGFGILSLFTFEKL